MKMHKTVENKDKKKVTALNGAVLYSKLLQIASGAAYADPSNDESEYAILDRDRYELIGDFIEAREHSVCFFSWRHQRDLLIEMAKKREIKFEVIDGSVSQRERTRIIAEYQAGKYQTLFANSTIAHGVTLTRGKRTIFASPTPNLEHFLQSYKRIYRVSQTEKTETVMVLATGTIDEYVWEQCQKKDARQSDLLAYVET